MIKLLKILYIKWIKGECKHLCLCVNIKMNVMII